MKITAVNPLEFDDFYTGYINKVSKDINLLNNFETRATKVVDFFESIPNDKLAYRYQKDKWTIKEVLQHIIDTERIFIYRCFRIARNDKTNLTGFDQNTYIQPSKANAKSMSDIINEYKITSKFTLSILKSLSETDLKCMGKLNGKNISARAAAFIVLGHEIWHIDVIKDKYL